MGMVFQDYALFPNMDVKSNIAFGLKNATELEKDNRVNYLLDLVNLLDCKHKYPHELSGGTAKSSISKSPCAFSRYYFDG